VRRPDGAPLTASAGVAIALAGDHTADDLLQVADDLLQVADDRLLAAKAGGKDRVDAGAAAFA
jgi:GGDEF domain-containing protein